MPGNVAAVRRPPPRSVPLRHARLGGRAPRSPWAALLLALAAALALFLAPRGAWAEAFDVNDTSWEGASVLLDVARGEIGADRVQIRGSLEWERLGPDDGVLVLHPTKPLDVEEATAFMRAGGRLALLDDYGRADDLFKRFQILRVPMPTRPVAALRKNPALAIAEPAFDATQGAGAGPHPIVANVQRVVTNHPTALRHPNLSPVLRVRAIGEPDAIVAVAAQVGKGRLFAMGDPSAVINQMLRYPGNRAFAAGLVRYLVEDTGSGRRGGKLYILANKFDQDGAYGGKSSLIKDVETALRTLLDRLDEIRKHGMPPWLQVAFAALLAVGVAIWVGRASAKTYQPPLPRYARAAPLVGQGGVAGRFAVLAAPSSPRALTVLELKSALAEGCAERFGLVAEPTLARVLELVGPSLDEETRAALRDLSGLVASVESSVLRGRPARLPRKTVEDAARTVGRVLEVMGVPTAGLPIDRPPHTDVRAAPAAREDEAPT